MNSLKPEREARLLHANGYTVKTKVRSPLHCSLSKAVWGLPPALLCWLRL